MIRLMGVLITIGAASMAGFLLAGRYTERCRILREWLSILTFLKTGIGYYHERLPCILKKIGMIVKRPGLAEMFKLAAAKMDYGSEFGVADIWGQLMRSPENFPLQPPDIEILSELGAYLGATDHLDQMAKITACYERLESNLHQAEVDCKKRVGLCRYSGFAIGMVLVLLLI